MSNDHSVGYGKPPKHTQFKKGQSGNPKGRGKGNRNLKTDLEEELREKVAVTEGGRKRRLTKQQIMLKSLTTKAAQGDIRAASLLLGFVLKVIDPAARPASDTDISAEDRKIIDSFLARHASPTPKKEQNND